MVGGLQFHPPYWHFLNRPVYHGGQLADLRKILGSALASSNNFSCPTSMSNLSKTQLRIRGPREPISLRM